MIFLIYKYRSLQRKYKEKSYHYQKRLEMRSMFYIVLQKKYALQQEKNLKQPCLDKWYIEELEIWFF